MITLSRNSPIAFVVGAAGFLGSHLIDRLLLKGVQVIGVDDLSLGRNENLIEAFKDKNFHFFHQSLSSNFNLEVPRLDYAVFIISENIPQFIYEQSLQNFLQIVKTHQAKILFVSNIEAYDENFDNHNLQYGEKTLAKFSSEEKINARVVRLSPVYGPRMNFSFDDPMFRLIKAAVLNSLQKESTPLDFTTRSIYVSDAIDLLTKALLHGVTAQKIYDGALLNPIKVTEVKQVLLDPLWHESRGFNPTELPPWPTPNLLKTEKELHWTPDTLLVTALKKTLHFFKEYPERLEGKKENLEKKNSFEVVEKTNEVKIEGIKESSKKEEGIVTKKRNWSVLNKLKNQTLLTTGLLIIGWALIYPLLTLAGDMWNFQRRLESGARLTTLAKFNEASREILRAGESLESLSLLGSQLTIFRKVSFLETPFYLFDQTISLGKETVAAALHGVKGSEYFYQGLKSLTGEGITLDLLQSAVSEFDQSAKGFASVMANLENPEFKKVLPQQFAGSLEFWQKRAAFYEENSTNLKNLAYLFGAVSSGNSSYLIVLQDNRNLRPGGGKLVSFAEITFADGKFISLKSGDIKRIDEKLKEVVLPLPEVKEDFSKLKGTLEDSNIDADFSNNAKLIKWFYQQGTGKKISGVISLDLSAMEKILEITGPIKLVQAKTTVDNRNIWITKESFNGQFLGEVFEEVIKSVLFLPEQDWLSLASVFNELILEKHLMVNLSSPELLAFTSGEGWTGVVPKQVKEAKGEREEFLFLVETEILGGEKDLSERAFNLETKIEVNGEVNHTLVVKFNKDKSTTKRRVKVYLPLGTKLTSVLWNNQEIKKKVSSFSDYGRAGYSIVLENGGEELILKYQDGKTLEFLDNNLKLKYMVVKQSGIIKDDLDFKLILPYNLETKDTASFMESLNADKNWEVNLKKLQF